MPGWLISFEHDSAENVLARPLRIEYPGAYYHVTARGVGRGTIFFDDGDREDFLQRLAKAHDRWGLVCHGYALMQNHSRECSGCKHTEIGEHLGGIRPSAATLACGRAATRMAGDRRWRRRVVRLRRELKEKT